MDRISVLGKKQAVKTYVKKLRMGMDVTAGAEDEDGVVREEEEVDSNTEQNEPLR